MLSTQALTASPNPFTALLARWNRYADSYVSGTISEERQLMALARDLEVAGLSRLAIDLLERTIPGSSTHHDHLLRAGYAFSASSISAQKGMDIALPLLPTITGYIPCFNAAHFLPEVIAALQSQSLPLAELLLVDDGSTDGSAEVAERLGCRVIRHPHNRGLGAARNTALQAASGEFIAAVDSDVVVDRYWAEQLMLSFSGCFAGASAIGGKLLEQHSVTIPDRWRQRIMPQHHGEHAALNKHIFGCNSLSRLSALRSIGGFDETLHASYEDIDISNRLAAAGFTTGYLPAAVARHLRSDSLLSALNAAYSWRLPPFELQGCFRHMQLLVAKWVVSVRSDLEMLQTIAGESDPELLFMTLLQIPHGIIRDLLKFGEENRTGITDAAIGYALCIRALCLREILPSAAVQLVIPYLAALFPEQQRAGIAILGVEAAECTYAGVGVASTPEGFTSFCAALGLPITDNSNFMAIGLGELANTCAQSFRAIAPLLSDSCWKNLNCRAATVTKVVVQPDVAGSSFIKNEGSVVTMTPAAQRLYSADVIEELVERIAGTNTPHCSIRLDDSEHAARLALTLRERCHSLEIEVQDSEAISGAAVTPLVTSLVLPMPRRCC